MKTIKIIHPKTGHSTTVNEDVFLKNRALYAPYVPENELKAESGNKQTSNAVNKSKPPKALKPEPVQQNEAKD